jgi:hypothetical protein
MYGDGAEELKPQQGNEFAPQYQAPNKNEKGH